MQKIKQTTKQTNNHANKQSNNQTNKQLNKQTNTQKTNFFQLKISLFTGRKKYLLFPLQNLKNVDGATNQAWAMRAF